MKRYERSKSSLFLMELLLNLLLFCVLCGCGLMFFIKSNNMTRSTTDLHNAIRITTSIASIYESGDGSFSSLREIYTDCVEQDASISIYFNESYAPCSLENSVYQVVIEQTHNAIGKISICFYNEKNEMIYSLNAFHYTPSTPASVKEVPAL